MSKLNRKELLEYFDNMRELWKMERLPLVDYQPKEEGQAYEQIKEMIQKSNDLVDEVKELKKRIIDIEDDVETLKFGELNK